MLPAGELACAAHIVQALEDVAFWYVSGGQSMHSEAPVASAKDPAGQLAHVSEAPLVAENVPTRQSVQFEAPRCEYLPASQEAHSEEPDISAKVPAGQSAHSSDPALLLLFPGAHTAQLADPLPK